MIMAEHATYRLDTTHFILITPSSYVFHMKLAL